MVGHLVRKKRITQIGPIILLNKDKSETLVLSFGSALNRS